MARNGRKTPLSNTFPVLILALTLLLCSCSIPPTYSRKNLEEIIQNICQKEFSLEVRVWDVGETIWVYAPLKLITEEGKLDYDEQKERLGDELSRDIGRISSALNRVLLSLDEPPNFYCFIKSNIEKIGVDWYTVVFLPDERVYTGQIYAAGRISPQQVNQRIVSFTLENYQALDDTEGKHIQPYDLSMEEFVAMLFEQNLGKEYLKEEVKDNFRVNEIAADYHLGSLEIDIDIEVKNLKSPKVLPLEKSEEIIQELLKAYSSFTNITTVKITDLPNKKSRTLNFSPGSDRIEVSSPSKSEKPLGKLNRLGLYNNLAASSYEDKDFDKAKRYYHKTLRLFSEHSYSYFGLGNTSFALELYQEALDYYKKALKIYPDDYNVNLNTGLCYLNLAYYHDYNIRPQSLVLQQADLAISHLKKTREINPKSTLSLLYLGFSYQLKKEKKKAQEYFNKVLKETDEDELLARAHLGLNHLSLALSHFEKAQAKDPENYEFYNDIGQVYQALEQWQKAIKSHEKALEHNPDSISAQANLAAIYAILKEYPKAIGYYKKIIKYCQEEVRRVVTLFKGYVGLGDIYDLTDKRLKALDYFREASKLDSISPMLYYRFGWTYMNLAQTEEALTNFKKAIELNPDFARCYVELGLIHSSQHQYQEARDNLNKAKKLFKTEKNYKALEEIDGYLKKIP
jgi:tetratricopeptide (TPR) repeat protein